MVFRHDLSAYPFGALAEVNKHQGIKCIFAPAIQVLVIDWFYWCNRVVSGLVYVVALRLMLIKWVQEGGRWVSVGAFLYLRYPGS